MNLTMKTPKEILLEIIPKDCYWEEMDNLTNTPIHYVIEAMESYSKQNLNIHNVSGSFCERCHWQDECRFKSENIDHNCKFFIAK